ncbi:MAG TPA: VOC family protein [Hyphomonadaceae bacterium]|nr:VOC family protein [Hyphomonadaceae bacterium]
MPRIAKLALLVRDYDEAIAWFSRCLGFELVEDTEMGNEKRWVVMRPAKPNSGSDLLLARAVGMQQASAIGNQTGGRVFLFLETDNFERDFSRLQREGVRIEREPKDERYGRVAVFQDLSGNLWDLIEPRGQ